MKSIHFSKNSFVFVLGGTGMVVFHKTFNQNLTMIFNLIENLKLYLTKDGIGKCFIQNMLNHVIYLVGIFAKRTFRIRMLISCLLAPIWLFYAIQFVIFGS